MGLPTQRAAAAAQATAPRETTGTLTINRRALGLHEPEKVAAGLSPARRKWAIGALAALVLAGIAFWQLRPDLQLRPEGRWLRQIPPEQDFPFPMIPRQSRS